MKLDHTVTRHHIVKLVVTPGDLVEMALAKAGLSGNAANILKRQVFAATGCSNDSLIEMKATGYLEVQVVVQLPAEDPV